MAELRIAVAGDRFMLPEVFREEILRVLPEAELRTLELPWPDEPMHHGYAEGARDPDTAGLKEFFGVPAEIGRFVGDASVFVTHLAPVSRSILVACRNLKLVAVSRGGPVNVDREALKERGVLAVNTPARNASAVAEFTIGAILAETRLIRAGHEALRAGDWRGDLYRADTTGTELSEMTVGIIGYGAIGARVVRLLKPFGCRILVCDPYVQLSASDRDDGVEHVGLDDLLMRSDVVSLHARVTPETARMIDAAALARMKRSAIFVNTARGPLVDYDALTEALANGRLRGAMLETFGVEPAPPDWPLLKLPNVTLTPHIAGASTTTVRIAAAMIAEDIRRFAHGEPPLHPIT